MGFQVSAAEIAAHHTLKLSETVEQKDVKEVATAALTMSDETTPATVGQSVVEAANSGEEG